MSKINFGKVAETVFYATAEKTTKIPCLLLSGQPKMPKHLQKVEKAK